jgi:hypothetical protein
MYAQWPTTEEQLRQDLQICQVFSLQPDESSNICYVYSDGLRQRKYSGGAAETVADQQREIASRSGLVALQSVQAFLTILLSYFCLQSRGFGDIHEF